MLTNTDRADRALMALEGYDNGSNEEDVIDLVTDLMHYCDLEDVDFETIIEMARFHFEAEKLEEITLTD